MKKMMTRRLHMARLAKYILPMISVAAISTPAHALLINATFDSGYNATQQAVVNNAISMYEGLITNNVTVDISFTSMNSGLGQSSQNFDVVGYNAYRSALSSNATSTNDITALGTLSHGITDSATGISQVAITTSQCAALGIAGCGQAGGSIGINLGLVDDNRSDGITTGQYDMQATVEHEIDEILGIGGGGSLLGTSGQGSYLGSTDLFRYSAPGTRTYSTSGSAYFSIDGGLTNLANFNMDSNGDYGDWGTGCDSVQCAFGTAGQVVNFSSAESTALDVIGWNLAPVPLPAPFVLMGSGLALLGVTARKRRVQ